ncbi:MAG: exodeoxyribonuclease VII small subunit [Coleofasciculus sp. C1-SOL-03]|jgi:exodeoxyribonuclease VII small subunit|uniref:exodeoxyribonuclease VII small subunit n=1 Tax=Coleofasciculus sp. C1-SOL-03 TaxID=3069522 RepID=UPI00330098BB
MVDPIASSRTHQTEPSLPPSWNYEATVAQVETIIEQIERGELELAEVFDQFASAVEYLRQCEAFLQQRQQQMDVLIETLTDESDSPI